MKNLKTSGKTGIVSLSLLLTALLMPGCTTLEHKPSSEEGEYIETLEVMGYSWNWLFLDNSEDLIISFKDQLLKEARDRYGQDVFLGDITAEKTWDARSFLLILHLAGYVEKLTLQAEILKTIIPVLEQEKITIYEIIPADIIRDAFGYIGIIYRTSEDLRADLNNRLSQGKISETDFAKEEGRIPDGGAVIILVGRKVNEQANTRNLNYELYISGKTPLIKKGKDLLANVPGRDGLWWNEETLTLDAEDWSEILLVVRDNSNRNDYAFTLRKVDVLETKEKTE